jgi:phosphoglycerate dehydrogenase-like enzyme
VKLAVPELFRRELDGRLPPQVDVAWYADMRAVQDAARDADVLVIGSIDPVEIRASIEAAADARWISTHAAGVDHYPFDLLRKRDVLFTKGAGVNAPPIAEFAVLCVLSAAKSFPYFLANSARGTWPSERPPAQELEGSQALVVGYGEIGRAIGERLRALGVRVTGVRRQPSVEPNVIGLDAWRDRLDEFDWVLIAAALTSETRHMFGGEEFSRMRPSAWLLNLSRGPLVDHAALARALMDGRPRGAYLDVTEPEPLPADHPLWGIPNVFITGHSAGRSPRSQHRYAALFVDNLERFRSGQPLKNMVDLSAGY